MSNFRSKEFPDNLISPDTYLSFAKKSDMICEAEPIDYQAVDAANIVQQTSFWAGVKRKQGQTPLSFSYKISDDLLDPTSAGKHTIRDDMVVLIQPIDKNHTLAYVPYGPTDEPVAENHGTFLEELTEAIRPHLPKNCIAVRYDLPWTNQWAKDDDYYDERGNWNGPPSKQSAEFRVNFKTQKHNLVKSQTNILPANTVFLNLRKSENELLKGMKSKTRYNIRLSQRRGVEVQSFGAEKTDDWYKLYSETAKRNSIRPHRIEFFRTVLRTAKERHTKSTDVKLLMAKHQGEYRAAMFLVLSARRALYLYGASSSGGRNSMATYALQWEAVKRAQNAGCYEYDMFGSAPNGRASHPMHGLYRFKTGFGGDLFHRMGCWDYPLQHENYRVFKAGELNKAAFHVV